MIGFCVAKEGQVAATYPVREGDLVRTGSFAEACLIASEAGEDYKVHAVLEVGDGRTSRTHWPVWPDRKFARGLTVALAIENAIMQHADPHSVCRGTIFGMDLV